MFRPCVIASTFFLLNCLMCSCDLPAVADPEAVHGTVNPLRYLVLLLISLRYLVLLLIPLYAALPLFFAHPCLSVCKNPMCTKSLRLRWVTHRSPSMISTRRYRAPVSCRTKIAGSDLHFLFMSVATSWSLSFSSDVTGHRSHLLSVMQSWPMAAVWACWLHSTS